MSCSTCLNHEKQPLKCVFDENGKSLEEYFSEITKDLKNIKEIVDYPIDPKNIGGSNISEIVQNLVNKISLLTKTTNIFSEKFYDSKGQVSTLQEVLLSILNRIEILEKRTTTSTYI